MDSRVLFATFAGVWTFRYECFNSLGVDRSQQPVHGSVVCSGMSCW